MMRILAMIVCYLELLTFSQVDDLQMNAKFNAERLSVALFVCEP